MCAARQAIARARELAHAAGIPQSQALAALAGDPLTVDLTAAGPWMPLKRIPLAANTGRRTAFGGCDKPSPPPAPRRAAPTSSCHRSDSLTGTVTVRNANWKADYLASHVKIAEATLHLDGSEPALGAGRLLLRTGEGNREPELAPALPVRLAEPQPCPAEFQMQFGDLDAGLLESALLGAQEKSTLLSDFIDRLHPSASPPWPALEGTVKADSLVLGPVTLHGVSAAGARAAVRVWRLPASTPASSAAAFTLPDRSLKPASDKDKPTYTFEGDFQKLDADSVGALLGLRWAGAPLNGNGKIELSGYTARGSGRLGPRRSALRVRTRGHRQPAFGILEGGSCSRGAGPLRWLDG